MEISGLETFAVAPPDGRGGREWVFLKLLTDGGIAGYGEVYVYGIPFEPPTVEAMLRDMVEGLVVGRDPYRTEALYQDLYAHDYGRCPEFTRLGLVSAIEMACWDLVGKDLGRPVSDLLGGAVHERLRSYTYMHAHPEKPDDVWHWGDPEWAARSAEWHVELGFTAVKLDPITDDAQGKIVPIQCSLKVLDRAEAVIRAMREAVGDRLDILIGTHGQMTAAGAIRLARRLEPYDPLWFEEPVPPENVAEMARVARATSIPIATGERLATKHEFARLIRHGAAAIFQMDVGRVGGITEARKIAGMAEAHYLHIAPHVWGGPIIAAASIQLDVCSPNFLIQESIGRWDGFHAELLREPIEWEGGCIVPSSRPGLGYELNEDVAREHAWTPERA